MEKSKRQKIERRLLGAKLSLLNDFPFYALLLTHIRFIADENCKSIACYNNDIIYLPEFIEKIDNEELQFVLMHLIMHLALGHPFRKQENYDSELFDLACDIVVNSNIIHSICNDERHFKNLKVRELLNNCEVNNKFKHIKDIQHLTPNNKEGYFFTADEVYKMLLQQKNNDTNIDSPVLNISEDAKSEGKNKSNKKSGTNVKTNDGDAQNTKKEKKKKKQDVDYNPNEDAELQELLKSLKEQTEERKENIKKIQSQQPVEPEDNEDIFLDDHTYWQGESEDELMPISKKWMQRCLEISDIMGERIGQAGHFPAGVKRKLKDFMEPKLDWRQVLNEFVQEEICDYSFSPPDKRMEDSPFFLPDFNETEAVVKKILFAIDCSGSMQDKEVTQCYSEIYHAILQFNGKLEGYVGFFDSAFYTPTPFEDIGSFAMAEPVGGGGTCIEPIFEYVNQEMCDDPPVSIIVLTDGEVYFPDESVANNIPVLWILTKKSQPPTWGRTISIAEDNNVDYL